jgi:hypothetical protein
VSSGIEGLKSLLEPAEATKVMAALGIGSPAAKGEVIVANLFHEKRFWFARIPVSRLKPSGIIFQLEHFPVLPNQITGNPDAAKTIEKNISFPSAIIAGFNSTIERLRAWANENIAGHTQIRLAFENEDVELTEQVLKKNQLKPRKLKIDNIVLTAEAQGTLDQVGAKGYDPVKAINPLFFSVNRITSLDEKYADMVINKGHRVQQMPLSGKQAPTPTQLLRHYLLRSQQNWHYMTRSTAQAQEGAVYRTIDFSLIGNRSRNCSTELIAALEAGRPLNILDQIKARIQDVSLQRVYPMLLGNALMSIDYISRTRTLPEMDHLPQNGNASKPLDPSLKSLRERLSRPIQNCKV